MVIEKDFSDRRPRSSLRSQVTEERCSAHNAVPADNAGDLGKSISQRAKDIEAVMDSDDAGDKKNDFRQLSKMNCGRKNQLHYSNT